MAETFAGSVEALFKGMEEFITTKTVVGEPVYVKDTIILPLVDVTFGCVASAKNEPQRHNGGGGMGGKMTPNSVLIIKDGTARLVSIKNQDGFAKLIDMAPDLVNRFMSRGKDPAVEEAVKDVSGKKETF